MSRMRRVESEEFNKVIARKTNDNYLALYISSVVKSVVGLHNLLNNRI